MPNTEALPGPIVSVAAAPSPRGGLLWLAAGVAGLHRSSGQDGPWQPVRLIGTEAENSPVPVSAVAIASSEIGEGTGPVIFAASTGIVWRSLDGGSAWTASALPAPAPAVTALATTPSFRTDRTVFAGSEEDGVMRSEDGGATWESWNFGLFDRHVFCLAVSPDYAGDGTLFAGTQIGVFRSGNGGRSWQQMPFPAEAAPVLSLCVAPGASERPLLCVGTENGGVFISRDGGQTWSSAAAAGQGVNALGIYEGRGDAYQIVAATEERLIVSQDRGESWQDWGKPVEGILCLAAPNGVDEAFPILVGLAEGGAAWLTRR